MLPENNGRLARYSIPVLLVLFVTVLLRHTFGHWWDNDLFKIWATHNAQWGLTKIYYSGSDYLPLYHYILYGYARLLGNAETLADWFPSIHMITFLFDILGIWFIYKWIEKRYDFNTLLLLLVFNVSYTYNTLIWGQVDGILSALMFAAIYFAWKGRAAAGAVFFVLGLNMKLQGIIFLPVFGLLYLFNIANRRNWQSVIMPVIALAVTQFIIIIPFLIDTQNLVTLWNYVVVGSVGRLSEISLNAYNFWYLFYKDPKAMSDTLPFIGGMSHNKFGLLAFMVVSFFAMLPLIISLWRKMVNKINDEPMDRRQVWLACALVNLAFFYFNTQMHERYCHPAFIFIAAYAYYTKDFFPFIVFSLAYFLSLDKVLQWLGLNSRNQGLAIYNPILLSCMYLLVTCYLFIRLAIISRRGTEVKQEIRSRFG